MEVIWLANSFNKILNAKKMLDKWRKSTVGPIYKNKGDIQNCLDCHGIKLMNYTLKI